MLQTILLVIQILVAVALTAVVLLQRSEGGALGMGGGPTGFMTARGAGDLLTRTTWILFTLFLVLCVALTLLAGRDRASSSVVDRVDIDALDPGALSAPPATNTAPAESSPEPLTAPTPTIQTPVLPTLPSTDTQAPAPAAPAQ